MESFEESFIYGENARYCKFVCNFCKHVDESASSSTSSGSTSSGIVVKRIFKAVVKRSHCMQCEQERVEINVTSIPVGEADSDPKFKNMFDGQDTIYVDKLCNAFKIALQKGKK